ncbi:hypothetical protein [Streptomyces syringium]|uniref:hypothetical protein n=1 Tax=Streptomyces syringium TaxID=76729 RepID=UPI0033C1AFCC
MIPDDPFADVSPWDEPANPLTEEKPVTITAPAAPVPGGPAPFKIGFTLKAGSGYESEWLTPAVYGYTAEETAMRGAELITAMKTAGLIDLTVKAAQHVREQYKGSSGPAPKRFENGKVVTAPAAGDVTAYSCNHGPRTFKDGGSWAAHFCGGRGLDKSQQCPPLWRQQDGTYRAK